MANWGVPLLARWTTDWDCDHETSWWYIIKDTPFDLSTLKAKRRYEITKGRRNFEIKKINPKEYMDDLYRITVEAYSGWPEKYRPTVNKEEFFRKSFQDNDVFIGESRESGEISGYAVLINHVEYCEFSVLRTKPEAEKNGINAAMVDGVLAFYHERFDGRFYICDGSRSIRHETAFQDYLEKYFQFRKAYCKLHVKYRFGVGLLVKLIYPFRDKISEATKIGSQIRGILRMEEFCHHI